MERFAYRATCKNSNSTIDADEPLGDETTVMKKTFTNLFILGALLTFGSTTAFAEEGTSNATVKMTYVNGSEGSTETSYGEIPADEAATAGFNRISGGQVGWANFGWGVNYITYIQVDVSDITGNITNATLTFEGSGSTDSNRTTGWGIGYNSSKWSADMTYDSADKSITTIGEVKWTSTKLATKFEEFSFDITEAVNKADEDGLITILVYETAAAGGYIKNPAVEVTWTTETTYNVTFKEGNDAKDLKVTYNDTDVTTGVSLPNGDYEFTATAPGFQDFSGSFTIDGADKEVEFSMTPKDVWTYTLYAADASGDRIGEISKGTGYANEDVTYVYPEYQLVETTLLSKAKDSTNPNWGKIEKLDTEDKEFTVIYDGPEVSNVVFYKEAEDMDGFISKATNNADIRCSNGKGGIVDGAETLLTTLSAGKYTVYGQVWGTSGMTAGVKIKGEGDEEDNTVWEITSPGYLDSSTSEEFTLAKETPLYVYTTGGNDNRMLDLIYIRKTGDIKTGVEEIAIESVEDPYYYSIDGVRIAEPTRPGLYIHNGKKIIIK